MEENLKVRERSEQKKQMGMGRGPWGAVSSPSQWDRSKAPENFEFSVSKTLNSDTSGNHFVDIN